jgi:hypothetical protein
MRKGKGLKLEEKRSRMLDIFKQDTSFFHLKDIEKLGVKKGIIYQAIKDVLDSLVNDYLVETDKIGSSNFYWSLPSKVLQTKKTAVEMNKKKIEEMKEEVMNLKEKIKEAKACRMETKERKIKMEELDQLNKQKEILSTELKEFQKSDPERHQNLLHDADIFLKADDTLKEGIIQINTWIKSKSPDNHLESMFVEVESLHLFDDEKNNN